MAWLTGLSQRIEIIIVSGIDPVVLSRKLYMKIIMPDNVFERVRDKSSRDTNLRSCVKYDSSIVDDIYK